MTFHRLLDHERGKILLVNLHETLVGAAMEQEKMDAALKAFHAVLGKLTTPYTPTALMAALGGVVFQDAEDFQLAGVERPDDAIYLAGVRPFSDVRAVLKSLLKQELDDELEERIRNVVSAGASESTVSEAAAILNDVRDMTPGFPFLTVGWKAKIFWATRIEDIADVRDRAAAAAAPFAHALRDYLGLVQYGPDDLGQPTYLFLFEGVTTVGKIKHKLKVRRPTTMDGFDNERFRQYRPGTGLAGCGMTVDLTSGQYTNGGPECVVTEVTLDHFKCHWVGALTEHAKGSDGDFLTFLSRRPLNALLGPTDYLDMAQRLDEHVA